MKPADPPWILRLIAEAAEAEARWDDAAPDDGVLLNSAITPFPALLFRSRKGYDTYISEVRERIQTPKDWLDFENEIAAEAVAAGGGLHALSVYQAKNALHFFVVANHHPEFADRLNLLVTLSEFPGADWFIAKGVLDPVKWEDHLSRVNKEKDRLRAMIGLGPIQLEKD